MYTDFAVYMLNGWSLMLIFPYIRGKKEDWLFRIRSNSSEFTFLFHQSSTVVDLYLITRKFLYLIYTYLRLISKFVCQHRVIISLMLKWRWCKFSLPKSSYLWCWSEADASFHYPSHHIFDVEVKMMQVFITRVIISLTLKWRWCKFSLPKSSYLWCWSEADASFHYPSHHIFDVEVKMMQVFITRVIISLMLKWRWCKFSLPESSYLWCWSEDDASFHYPSHHIFDVEVKLMQTRVIISLMLKWRWCKFSLPESSYLWCWSEDDASFHYPSHHIFDVEVKMMQVFITRVIISLMLKWRWCKFSLPKSSYLWCWSEADASFHYPSHHIFDVEVKMMQVFITRVIISLTLKWRWCKFSLPKSSYLWCWSEADEFSLPESSYLWCWSEADASFHYPSHHIFDVEVKMMQVFITRVIISLMLKWRWCKFSLPESSYLWCWSEADASFHYPSHHISDVEVKMMQVFITRVIISLMLKWRWCKFSLPESSYLWCWSEDDASFHYPSHHIFDVEVKLMQVWRWCKFSLPKSSYLWCWWSWCKFSLPESSYLWCWSEDDASFHYPSHHMMQVFITRVIISLMLKWRWCQVFITESSYLWCWSEDDAIHPQVFITRVIISLMLKWRWCKFSLPESSYLWCWSEDDASFHYPSQSLVEVKMMQVFIIISLMLKWRWCKFSLPESSYLWCWSEDDASFHYPSHHIFDVEVKMM